MKTILNAIKTILLTGAIAMLMSIPAMADSNDLNILKHYTDSKGDTITQYKDGTHYTNCNVVIQSISYIDNSITIQKDNDLYKFYVDDPQNYYLTEIINVTFNNDMDIVDCIVLDLPQIYSTEIIYSANGVACFRVNDNVYSFNYNEQEGSWLVGDKCKVIIQNDNVLEVKPIND